MTFLDETAMSNFPTETFTNQTPFPWHDFSRILRPDAFDVLHRNYPPLALFESHVGKARAGGQRPHDRWYLAYEQSIYERENGQQAGVAAREDLPTPWQEFMDELHASASYQQFIARLLGENGLTARYAWHVGINGSEVSPHRDAENKVGTHIFYFNTSQDWNNDWGGQTLALGGKKTMAPNPDFEDFESESATKICDNHSFLFKNTENAWHGVRTLTCPPEKYRRLFNVIFHADEPKTPKKSGLLGRLLGRDT